MLRVLKLLLISAFGYLNMSCWCTSPKPDKEFVDFSALIIEGKITSIGEPVEDTTNGNFYADVTIKVLKLYKGEKESTVILRHEMTSCGFLGSLGGSSSIPKFINRKCILYSTLVNGSYGYHMCDNRIIFEKLSKHKFYEEDYKKDLPIFAAKYKREKAILDSLVKLN